jgi:hypothetical protein
MIEDVLPEEIISTDISDAQVDKFFESGGKELGAPEPIAEEEVVPVEETSKEEPLSEQQVEEEKHARNYQAAMKEERFKRQELQKQLEENKQQVARMESAFEKILTKQQQEAQKPIPSYEVDPIGHLHYTQQEMADYVIKQNQYLAAQEQAKQYQMAQTQAQNKFMGSYQAAAKEFADSNPEFLPAYNYLVQSRLEEYKTLGYDDDTANKLLIEDEAAIVSKAFKDGVNPAERIFAGAKLRGFKNQATQDDSAQKESEKQLTKIQEGRQANRSLGSTPGKTPTDKPTTLSKISSLADDELDELISNPKEWAKLMKAG